ncbi:pyruvate, phosphate dikinase [archaeon]|nr:pyruvate, phosphate dikinase [archaeon]
MDKGIYLFEEGNAEMAQLLGNKGAQLSEMTKTGIPVPSGFVITTERCIEYSKKGEMTEELKKEIDSYVQKIEEKTGKKFGDKEQPLLFSVRSGAAISMPGMMDTILNLGLNDDTVEGLAKGANNDWFAYDSYRRFLQMFGEIVLGEKKDQFENIIAEQKKTENVTSDQEISLDGMKAIVTKYKETVNVPQNLNEQLYLAVEAVFKSWNGQRAKDYRRYNKLPDNLGTGVNVQTMVFGNLGESSGTGVVFTRNPATGEKKLYGEFLLNAQGEDIVSGARTPQSIDVLEKAMPEAYKQLVELLDKLEKHYTDTQDIEFTIENGTLFLLQTRTAKRTVAAAVKMAVDMVDENLITKEIALTRIQASSVEKLLHKQLPENLDCKVLTTGLPASPGAACGKIAFTADDAERRANAGEKVILVRTETSPDDVHGIIPSQGTLTLRGGVTSHAAVVCRGLGIPCVSGCGDLEIDMENKLLKLGETTLSEEDFITLDGTTGRVIPSQAKLTEPELSNDFLTILDWADEKRKLKVYTNADTPKDAKKALELGAEGIGLCRTEHMFMSADRLPNVQEMILSQTKEEREKALAKLLPEQRKDFKALLEIMEDKKLTIRLLDPPLHEFLPDEEDILKDIAAIKKTDNKEALQQKEILLKKTRSLHETNPMLGHRGIRLGLVYPEIYRMQVRAIIEAASEVQKNGGKTNLVIELPLVAEERELSIMKKEIGEEAKKVMEETGERVDYLVGTMIELPRACIIADKIAEHVDFISFGTNDLTQTTFGFSRDDAEDKFLHYYFTHKILDEDPFIVLDKEGVGVLMQMAIDKARSVKSDIQIVICGEQGGEPKSVGYSHEINLDAVSCSPYRVPIARLAAAQAALGKQPA